MDRTVRNRVRDIPRGRFLSFPSFALLALLSGAPAQGKSAIRFRMPGYYLADEAIYSGEYRDAERELRRESRRGIRTTQARWIDSICYHAMLGEVLYHQGRNAEALAEFDQACQVILAYPNWLLQVQFQPQPPRPTWPVRRPPLGTKLAVGHAGPVAETEQVFIGELDPRRALQQGGVVRSPVLADQRGGNHSHVGLGDSPAQRAARSAGHARPHLERSCRPCFARGNLSPPNHWSSAWIDVLRGVAQAGRSASSTKPTCCSVDRSPSTANSITR